MTTSATTPSSARPDAVSAERLRAARCLAAAIAVGTAAISIAFALAPSFSVAHIAPYAPRNDHLMADIGAFQLAIALALAGFAWRPDQWLLPWVALGAQSAHALSHVRDDLVGTAVAGSKGFQSALPNFVSWALVAAVVVLATPRRTPRSTAG